MRIFDEGFNQVILLIGHRSPLCHTLAAGRLRMLCRIAKTKEHKTKLHQAAHLWLETLKAMATMTKKVSKEALPLMKKVEQVCGHRQLPDSPPSSNNRPGPPPAPVSCCGEASKDDGFFDDFPFDESLPKNPKQKVRPSRVIQPGPLGPILDRLRSGEIDSEDELRTWCVFGEGMFQDGRLPRAPLVDHPTIVGSNAAIVKLYRDRRIDRTWAKTSDWEVDTALVEDMILLLILTKGECSTDDIDFHARFLLPFMRRWNAIEMGLAFRDAHEKFRKANVIARSSPRKYELTSGWEEKLRPTLLAAWESVRDPEPGSGSRRQTGDRP